jgi:hypothetical protein
VRFAGHIDSNPRRRFGADEADPPDLGHRVVEVLHELPETLSNPQKLNKDTLIKSADSPRVRVNPGLGEMN